MIPALVFLGLIAVAAYLLWRMLLGHAKRSYLAALDHVEQLTEPKHGVQALTAREAVAQLRKEIEEGR